MAILEVSEIDPKDVEELRRRFLDAVKEEENEYEEVDIERVKRSDWSIQRYIIDRDGDLVQALDMLKKTMKWRKSEGVNHMKESDFPPEFFKIGELYAYENDKNGVPTGYVRARCHKKFNEFQKAEERFVLYFFESMEKKCSQVRDGQRWNFVWDCDSATLFNTNIDLIKFFILTLLNHYPMGPAAVYVHQLPLILWAIYQLARSLLPERYTVLLSFTDRKSIRNVVGEENLPDYFEGSTCIVPYRNVPHSRTMEQVAEDWQINQSAIDKFNSHYKKWMQ